MFGSPTSASIEAANSFRVGFQFYPDSPVFLSPTQSLLAKSASSLLSTSGQFLSRAEQNTGQSPFPDMLDPVEYDRRAELQQWVSDGVRVQEDTYNHENDFCGRPMRAALDTLRGPLSPFVDFTAMVAEGVAGLQYTSPMDLGVRIGSRGSSSSPNPGHAPSNLDQSMPSHRGPAAAFQTPSTQAEASASVEELENDERKQRKFSTSLTDASVIKQFAGVRNAKLEGACRVEGIVWAHYAVNASPNCRIKLTIWFVRHISPSTLRPTLSSMITRPPACRHSAASSKITGGTNWPPSFSTSSPCAGYLERAYPEDKNYWNDLLMDPTSDGASDAESDRDMDDYDLGYPTSDEVDNDRDYNTGYAAAGPSRAAAADESSDDSDVDGDGNGPFVTLDCYSYPPGLPGGWGIHLH
ncbi:hypothetical protein B0H16DRAFT_1467523 [Mycena metata]|uniref:Uncharacterized protein n=1 Tax=Mycena metata TaxID=1033252 RepID=A0AAD7I5N9_9AGAR|nr:hypothetical protein B0H16DRAFT_1467523 [Mycena metata]